jgi:hypothetical protein
VGAWLDRLAASTRPLLWLDDIDYSERLLAGGAAPWLDVASLVSWRRKALVLFDPDQVTLPLAPLSAAWIREHEALRKEMAAKRRATAPLRTLLASVGLRAHVAETLGAFRASSPLPLALVIPSPRRWVMDAQRAAFGEAATADEDASDGASVIIADFLRSFGECGVDVLLLEEDSASAPASSGELGWYRSTINVARHYGWDVGLRSELPLDAQGEIDFVISPSSTRYVEVGADFWSTGAIAPLSAGGFRFLTVPADAQPQIVLDRLDALR